MFDKSDRASAQRKKEKKKNIGGLISQVILVSIRNELKRIETKYIITQQQSYHASEFKSIQYAFFFFSMIEICRWINLFVDRLFCLSMCVMCFLCFFVALFWTRYFQRLLTASADLKWIEFHEKLLYHTAAFCILSNVYIDEKSKVKRNRYKKNVKFHTVWNGKYYVFLYRLARRSIQGHLVKLFWFKIIFNPRERCRRGVGRGEKPDGVMNVRVSLLNFSNDLVAD